MNDQQQGMPGVSFPTGTAASQGSMMSMPQQQDGSSSATQAAMQPMQVPNGMMMMPQHAGQMMMYDPSQMQHMANFGAFPGMAQGGYGMGMAAGNGLFFSGMQPQQQGGDGQGAAMAQANTVNSSAALAGAMNPAMMQQPGAAAMNPAMMMMGDPNMFLQMQTMMQQAAGSNFFGQQPGQQANMFGLPASYLSMAHQAGMGPGTADLQQSMMVGGSSLNPFAKPAKAAKKKVKGKPKRPLSAYNLFFQKERARILSDIPDDKSGKKKIKKEEGSEEPGDKDATEAKTKDAVKVKMEDPSEANTEDAAEASIEDGATEAKAEEAGEGEACGDEKKDDADDSKDAKDEKVNAKKRKRIPHGKIGFESLAKMIGRRWKELSQEELQEYKDLAEEDMKRYRKEMEIYLQKQREGLEQSREKLEGSVSESATK